MELIKLHEARISFDDVVYNDEFNCYLLNELPKEKEYFDYGDDKGYIVLIEENEIIEKDYKKYTIYYESNLGEWEKHIIDVAEVCSVCLKLKNKEDL